MKNMDLYHSSRPPISADIKAQPYRGFISSSTYTESMDMISSHQQVQSILSPVKHNGLDSYSSGIQSMAREQNHNDYRLTRPSSPSRQYRNPVSSGSSQLTVRHTSSKGTQEGVLFPKYQVDSTSKCIMCKDCGIFFSHDAFLHHLHDVYGKRVECYGQFVELAVDAPNLEQLQLFQDFLAKLGVSQDRLLNNTGSYDGSKSPGKHGTHSSSSSFRPSSPVPNTWTNGIQETVLASEKLLKETSDYLKSSAKKMKHRRQRSFQMQGLPPMLSEKEDNSLQTLPANSAVPIIKTNNSNPTSKKSLQKYFISNPGTIPMRLEKPQSITAHDQPSSTANRIKQLSTYPSTHESNDVFRNTRTHHPHLQDPVTSSQQDDITFHAKHLPSSIVPSSHESNDVFRNTSTHHPHLPQDLVTTSQEDDITFPTKHLPSSIVPSISLSTSLLPPVEDEQLKASSVDTQAIDSNTRPSVSSSMLPSDSVDGNGTIHQVRNGGGNFGAITMDDLHTSKDEQLPTFDQDKKNGKAAGHHNLLHYKRLNKDNLLHCKFIF